MLLGLRHGNYKYFDCYGHLCMHSSMQYSTVLPQYVELIDQPLTSTLPDLHVPLLVFIFIGKITAVVSSAPQCGHTGSTSLTPTPTAISLRETASSGLPFGCTTLISSLPGTPLKETTNSGVPFGCTSLTSSLPATPLKETANSGLPFGCTTLTPSLPNTLLSETNSAGYSGLPVGSTIPTSSLPGTSVNVTDCPASSRLPFGSSLLVSRGKRHITEHITFLRL